MHLDVFVNGNGNLPSQRGRLKVGKAKIPAFAPAGFEACHGLNKPGMAVEWDL